MGSPLATIYSTIDSAKRKVMDALMNPVDTWKNGMEDANQRAGRHLMLLDQTLQKSGKTDPAVQAELTDDILGQMTNFMPAGILAGPRAKGIDNIALAYAMKDARKGRAPKEIWQERGWGKGPDGFWRTELSDLQARPIMKDSQDMALQYGAGGAGGPLKESFKHDEFASAYPGIYRNSTADFQVSPFWERDHQSGGFSRFGGGEEGGHVNLEAGTIPKLREGVLHELQHAVQRKEGFTGGSNPVNFMRTTVLPTLEDATQAFNKYYRVAGEAEARLVQNRADLPDAVRRLAFPFDPDIFKHQSGVNLDELLTTTGRPLK